MIRRPHRSRTLLPAARSTLRTALRFFLVAGALALAAPEASVGAGPPARPPGEADGGTPPFRSEERVTAIDLMVELPQPHLFRMDDEPPAASELLVVLDGRSLPVFAVDPPPADRGDAPWSLVVYFDLALSDRSQVSWAAEQISDRLPELTRLGPVELVVADPEPRTVVSPTRDADRIAQVLDRMIFFPEAEDALVEARLARATPPDDNGPGAPGHPDPGSGSSRLEVALVRDRLDRLLLALADRTADTHGRRAVFLVTGGFELGTNGSLREATEETAATLAAYGWTVLPLLRPPPEGTEPGFRIGKWHLFKPSDTVLVGLPMVRLTRESERDPEKARAFLELALARQRQGELEGASRAARRAMTHFDDDPRTSEPQARALRVLAEVYEAQGHDHLARRTYLRAATRDPDTFADHPAVAAALDRPHEALELLAGGTLGAVVREERTWHPALRTLDRRGLVSVQLPGVPDGRLHAVRSVRTVRGGSIPAASTVRFGTPRPVVAARARQLLDDVPSDGELPVSAALLRAHGRTTLALQADPTAVAKWAAVPREAVLRAMLAVPGEDGEAVVIPFEAVRLSPAPSAPWSWELRHEVALPPGSGWGVVVVDDLLSSAWGAALAQPEVDRDSG